MGLRNTLVEFVSLDGCLCGLRISRHECSILVVGLTINIGHDKTNG